MTIESKYFELIQADIDDEIDAAGKAELLDLRGKRYLGERRRLEALLL